MFIFILIVSFILWCVIGYFVNISAADLMSPEIPFSSADVKMCMIFSWLWPYILFICVLCFMYDNVKEISFDFKIFSKLAEWHNKKG